MARNRSLLATDPPYGVSYDASWRDGVYNALGPAEKTYMRIDGHSDGDDATARARWRPRAHSVAVATPRSAATLGWTGPRRSNWSALAGRLRLARRSPCRAKWPQGLERIGFEIVAQVIWDKGLFAMGRSWYHWSHEPCWVVRKKGAKVRFLGITGPGHDLARSQPQDDHGWLG